MREFERKRNIKKILASPPVLALMGVILVVLVRGTWGIYQKNQDSIMLLRSAEDRLNRLQDRQEKLTTAINTLRTESGIEAEIRDRFQMAKVGEREVVIVDAPKNQESAELPEPTFLQKIWNFFTIR